MAGVVWWAIAATKSTPAPNAMPTKLRVNSSGYLDLHKRYQIIEPFPVVAGSTEQQGQVLDCQPFQLSVLESLVIKTLQEQNAADFAHPETSSLWVDAMEVLGIPAIALPYISLNSQFYHALPAIHNAWQSEQHMLLLLENRSSYPSLMEVWQKDSHSIPALQILQWLYEMVELWQAMDSWNCQQSLLVLDNLRVDAEDQILCLQRLYFNPPDTSPSLQALGRLWQSILADSTQVFSAAMTQLLTDMEEQRLATPEAVQARIETIAQMEQGTLQLGDEDANLDTDELPLEGKDRDRLPTSIATAELSDMKEQDVQFDSDEMPTIVLPMQLASLEEVGRTDVGQQRDHNEDYFGIETQVSKLETPSGKTVHARNLYILCDGMGGHAGGEIASALATDTIRSYFKSKWQHQAFPGTDSQDMPDVATMTEAVLLANKAIYDINQANACSGSGRMGTTLVMVLIHDTEVAVAHVGDSRLYRYTRKRGLEQMTVDHEVGQREIQRGVDANTAYARPDAYQLTQALGPRDENFVKPDVQFFELNEDMVLLLCSDGLTDNDLLEKHWESHVQPLLSSQTNLDKGVGELIDLANQYNGHDNVTVIVVRAKVRPCLEHLR
jgi:protein phosphatase